MKKFLCLFICVSIVLSSTNITFAKENSSISNNELRDLAIEQNKVLSEEEYNRIRNEYKDNVIGLDNALKKYYITTDKSPIMKIASEEREPGKHIGEVTITEEYLHVFNKETGNNFDVGAVSSGKPIDYTDAVLGFLSFVPKIGVIITIASILKSVVEPEDKLTADKVGFKEQYSSTVTVKKAEKWDGTTWYIGAVTDKRVVDGFYLVSGYAPEFFSTTVNVGVIRIDTAWSFDDDENLLKIARAFTPGFSCPISYTYVNGTHEYPLKEYK